MQFGYLVVVLGLQPTQEVLDHERVIAEPVSFQIQRLQQQLARDNGFQHDLARLHAGQRLTKRGG